MKQGFTLLELSIVLVIIGLIIGGITAGADMIRAAELNSVISDYNKYKVAVNSFKLKYNAIPGDMDNAEAYWGQAATGTDCADTASTGTETCNGDGNGSIDPAVSTTNEKYRFWQHLANAEIISGSFSGVGPAGSHDSKPGENVPAVSGMSDVGITPYNLGNFAGNTSNFAGKYNNYWIFGRATAPTGAGSGPAFTPPEMQQIDSKIDDGKPAKGTVKTSYWNSCTDAASSSDLDADYLLSLDTEVCAPLFVDLF